MTPDRLDALRALAASMSSASPWLVVEDRPPAVDLLAEAIAEIDRLHAKRGEWGAHYEWSEALVAAADTLRQNANVCADPQCGWPECEAAQVAVTAYDKVRAAYPRRET